MHHRCNVYQSIYMYICTHLVSMQWDPGGVQIRPIQRLHPSLKWRHQKNVVMWFMMHLWNHARYSSVLNIHLSLIFISNINYTKCTLYIMLYIMLHGSYCYIHEKRRQSSNIHWQDPCPTRRSQAQRGKYNFIHYGKNNGLHKLRNSEMEISGVWQPVSFGPP